MFLRKRKIVAQRLNNLFKGENVLDRQKKEFYPSKYIKALFDSPDNSLTPNDFRNALGHYNLRDSLEKIAILSIDLFWNNAPDNPNRVNPSLKLDPNLEIQYHQYGLAFAAHMLLTSKANDHKNIALTWADCLYLCALYDEKLYMGQLNSVEDLDAWMTRLQFARFKHDFYSFDRDLAKNLFLLVDIFPELDDSGLLIDNFCNKVGYELIEYFVYCFAILSTIKETRGIIKDKHKLTGDIGDNLNHVVLHRLIDELTSDYNAFKRIDKEINNNAEIAMNFHETLFNPLIKKPLISTVRRSKYRILPNCSLLSQALSSGLLWMLRDFSQDFQPKFYGKMFEQYFKKIAQAAFPNVLPVDEFQYKPGAKFYDFSFVFEDKIYFFEIKSKVTYLKFNQTGSFDHGFKKREREELEHQLSKIELLRDDNYSEVFQEKLGADFKDKQHIPIFVFDINLISNVAFRENYIGKDIVSNPNYSRTIFISMNDLEELYLTNLGNKEQSVEDVYATISTQVGNPKCFFKGALSNGEQKDYPKDNIFKARVDKLIQYIKERYYVKSTILS
jgi:hypothetical protein